jgi:DNA-binding transcriptional regulator LsrR (DeoR family)
MNTRIKSRTEQVVERRTGRDLGELLRELYVDQRHTQEEIARALGVHRVTVNQWLASFGIDRDDRGPVEIPA